MSYHQPMVDFSLPSETDAAELPRWSEAPYVVNAYKAILLRQELCGDVIYWDRIQAADYMGIAVEDFERYIKCDRGPKGIDPDHLIFTAEEIVDYALRLCGTNSKNPNVGKCFYSSPPKFMSPAFFAECKRLQAAVMRHNWPSNAVMITAKLVDNKVKDIAGFNQATLDRVASNHTRLIFNCLQEAIHGRNPYRKGKAISPAIVVPERISKPAENRPPHLVSLHYHAVIGFDDYAGVESFTGLKAVNVELKLRKWLRNGRTAAERTYIKKSETRSKTPEANGKYVSKIIETQAVHPEIYSNIDINIKHFKPNEGRKAFSYSTKYVYDLLDHAEYCIPQNAKSVK